MLKRAHTGRDFRAAACSYFSNDGSWFSTSLTHTHTHHNPSVPRCCCAAVDHLTTHHQTTETPPLSRCDICTNVAVLRYSSFKCFLCSSHYQTPTLRASNLKRKKLLLTSITEPWRKQKICEKNEHLENSPLSKDIISHLSSNFCSRNDTFAGSYIIPKFSKVSYKKARGVQNPAGRNDWYAAAVKLVKIVLFMCFKICGFASTTNVEFVLSFSTLKLRWWHQSVNIQHQCLCVWSQSTYPVSMFVVEPVVKVGELWRAFLQDLSSVNCLPGNRAFIMSHKMIHHGVQGNSLWSKNRFV